MLKKICLFCFVFLLHSLLGFSQKNDSNKEPNIIYAFGSAPEIISVPGKYLFVRQKPPFPIKVIFEMDIDPKGNIVCIRHVKQTNNKIDELNFIKYIKAMVFKPALINHKPTLFNNYTIPFILISKDKCIGKYKISGKVKYKIQHKKN